MMPAERRLLVEIGRVASRLYSNLYPGVRNERLEKAIAEVEAELIRPKTDAEWRHDLETGRA